jgi:hypothetical protein
VIRRSLTGLLAAAGIGLALAPGGGGGAASAPPTAPPAGLPHPSRVAVMVLENRSFRQVIGRADAPYLNRLARRYALETRYYALTHPSLPNYIAMTTGATGEVTGNCSTCDTERPSLVNQLATNHIPWRAYFESLPRNAAAPVTARASYNKHYNPFVYNDRISDSPRSTARVVGFRRLRQDLATRSLPRFSWIAPNVHHDGHNHPLRAADRYAARMVPRVLRALGPHGVLYLTWDEGSRADRAGVSGGPGGGRIALIAAGGAARHHVRLPVPADHYALLRTIEANFGLPPLGDAGSASTPLLTGLLRGAR